ncbi:Mob1/phocein family protein [Trichomonas vaginalis G3]|uniref:Mob1/phocein family protein n=1 Tax=Trichomonas vaginalis (strain ATCC PRA-98 / G3) TaxID=412133 RepID=A2E8Q8_TRIV3|nr:MPS One Binder (MOB) kinase activator-like family [Trichomonas vaginalis G3]EAY10997.1 Mob1/phocein family protein [Trichomonas vaginalis G3]KAI5530803.1 MPS One Binder (MOB) kinase activator-like family [Trichomonas vaginalis G3]|eukprot:XP_001323220.1 Mob1/phocein family protein [Trichomonas vaginalis G3]
MKSFVNKPGTGKAEFNNVPFEEDPTEYRTVQYYIQALLKKYPNDIDRLVKCPEKLDKNSWIYASFRQFLKEINYFAYEHRFVSTAETMPKMQFTINGNFVECRSAAKNPPAPVPAIDYITQTVDMATVAILDQTKFPSGVINPDGLNLIMTYMRRLYRVFSYSYICHREVFDELEEKTHLCERFTRFAREFNLIQAQDIHIPDSYFEQKRNQEQQQQQQ